jgi:hypothetical protein
MGIKGNKFNVIEICTSGKCTHEQITTLYNYYLRLSISFIIQSKGFEGMQTL